MWRGSAATSAGYVEMSGGHPGEYLEYAASGQTYDEVRPGDAGETEYRYADLPLALGESIMVNHALFAGLHHTGAVPITDEPFHSRVLGHKLRRAAAQPEIAEVIDRRSGGMSAAALASTALSTLKLPILDVSVPLAEILEYRRKHADGLAALRERMTRLARQIDSEPWSAGFSRELEKRFLPDLADDLADARKARDAWLASSAKKAWYAAAGVAFGAASVALAVARPHPIAPQAASPAASRSQVRAGSPTGVTGRSPRARTACTTCWVRSRRADRGALGGGAREGGTSRVGPQGASSEGAAPQGASSEGGR
ncbi:MAG: hypothetical protein IPG04_42690 [Polyangiaceae bacterium]|nr:hypothetical protein [Polyangiaceae bacterium]